MKDTSRELKDYGHELANGGDVRVAMGDHRLCPSFREDSPWAGRGSDSKSKGVGKLKALEYGLSQLQTSACVTIWQSRYCSFSVSPGVKWSKKYWSPLESVLIQALEKFQEFIITILLMPLLLSFRGLLYWSNDPLILFCWLYRWSFKATVKCTIKSSRQLTVLIYKQMQPIINRRFKWCNGWAGFYIKSYNLSLLSPQPSVLRHRSAGKEAASVPIVVHPPLLQTLNLRLKKIIPWTSPLFINSGDIPEKLANWYVQVFHVVQLCWSYCNPWDCFPGTPRN